MGKKVRSKGGNPHKVHTRHASSSSPRTSAVVPKQSDPEVEVGDEEVANGESCKHYDENGIELKRVLMKIHSNALDTKCEDCRDDPINRRGNKGKGKGSKKKGSSRSSSSVEVNSEAFWVCLSCSHIGCGGGVSDSVPYGHARRHSKQERHPLVALLDNPALGWCLTCDSKITIEIPEGLPSESKRASDVGDVEFHGDGVENGNKTGDDGEILVVDAGKGYAVRGLVNLGNTCFFNSVMQNLFATEMMRHYFSSLRETIGPLTMALKKLFSEVSAGMETNRSTVNPRNFFSCICSKAPQFKGYDQHDSHELLRCLLDGLSTEELNKRKSENFSNEDKSSLLVRTTFVDTIFGGQLSSSVCCTECGYTSVVHEPFLDLSLPVPSKKVPPKKLLSASQKKNKFQPREVPKSRRTQERVGAKRSNVNQQKSESNAESSEPKDQKPSEPKDQSQSQSACSPLESGGSYCSPAFDQEQVASIIPEDNEMSWLDYIEPTVAPLDINSDSDGKENPASETHVISVLKHHESNVCGSLKEQAVVLECSGEACAAPPQSRDNNEEPLIKVDGGNWQVPDSEAESSVARDVVRLEIRESTMASSLETDDIPLLVEDNEVLLLPFTETVSTARQQTEMAVKTQESADIVDVDNNLTEKASSAVSTLVSCEPEEMEFDGLGDLFAEPEVSSDLGNGAAILEEADASWLVEASSESNQEEVDDANAPVSVGSCLAFFTKPELLTDEHAWHCENCSRILQQQNVKKLINKNGIADDYAHEGELDPEKERGKMVSQSLQMIMSTDGNFTTFSESKVLENGASTSNTCNTDAYMETNRDSSMDDPLSYTMSDITMCKLKRNKSQEKSGSSSSLPSCKENCQETSWEDENVLSATSQYFSCNSHAEGTNSSVNPSYPDNNSCSRDELNEDGYEVQSLATFPNTAVTNKEENMCNPRGKGTSITMEKMKKNVKKTSKGVKNKTETTESEIVKVKRNATKRILIDKVPPVLTIHLKRFSQDGRGRLNKLSGHVNFEEMLDLAPYMDPRSRGRNERYCFQLVGVIEHSGSMRGGHYIAYIRGEKSGRQASNDSSSRSWFYASDTLIREASLAEVLQSEAYILFYRRV